MTDARQLLKSGIRAAKSGDQVEARRLLMEYLEVEQESEKAWLWLSRVVEQTESKRVCLENVLTLNPDNDMAKTMLQELNNTYGLITHSDQVDTSEAQAQMLQDWTDRGTVSGGGDELIYEEYNSNVAGISGGEYLGDFVDDQSSYEGSSIYEDIWATDADLCAYCAGEVLMEDRSCRQCSRSLIEREFRLRYPSFRIGRYAFVLLALIPLFAIPMVYNLYYRAVLPNATILILVDLIFCTVLGFLAYGVYQRQIWAYKSSFFLLGAMIVVGLIQLVGDSSIADFIEGGAVQTTVGAEEKTGSFLWNIIFYLVDTQRWLPQFLEIILPGIQVFAAFVVFYYGYLIVSPDFDQDDIHLVARMDETRLELPADYYVEGKESARRQRWATAVLYFQGACMRDPHKLLYQQALAMAYAQLKFYKRSVDTYLYVRSKAGADPKLQKQIDMQVAKVQELAYQETQTKKMQP